MVKYIKRKGGKDVSNELVKWLGNGLLKNPGDKITAYVTPKGKEHVIKISTEAVRATFRQSMKKDGTPGKIVKMFME